MTAKLFSPLFTIHLESVGSEEFTLELAPHTSNRFDGGANFLPSPDNIDDTSDPTYFYFGWIDVDNGWLIHRQDRLSSLTTDATIANNGTMPDLATAWPSRATLAYS
jgi:hypothetical protein